VTLNARSNDKVVGRPNLDKSQRNIGLLRTKWWVIFCKQFFC